MAATSRPNPSFMTVPCERQSRCQVVAARVKPAMWTGLMPVTLGGYDIGEREVWLVSGLIALVSIVAVWVTNYRTSYVRHVGASLSRASMVLETAGYGLLFFLLLAALILVVLGLLPDQEPALYLTALVLGLFVSALSLLWLVFAHRGTATASAEVGLPAE